MARGGGNRGLRGGPEETGNAFISPAWLGLSSGGEPGADPGGGPAFDEGGLGGPPAGGGSLGFTPGGGGGAGGLDQLDVVPGARGQMPRDRAAPGGGAGTIEPVNLFTLAGDAALGAGWTRIGPFPGPVILQPVGAIVAGPVLASPQQVPVSDFLALRGRGNGVIYLPWGGYNVRWWVKYSAAGNLNLAIYDARNPALAGFLLAHPYATGAQQRRLPTRVTVTVASTELAAANPYRTGLMIWPTGPGFLDWGQAATLTSIPFAAANAPIFFSDEFNIREQVNAIVTAATVDVLVAEWLD